MQYVKDINNIELLEYTGNTTAYITGRPNNNRIAPFLAVNGSSGTVVIKQKTPKESQFWDFVTFDLASQNGNLNEIRAIDNHITLEFTITDGVDVSIFYEG